MAKCMHYIHSIHAFTFLFGCDRLEFIMFLFCTQENIRNGRSIMCGGYTLSTFYLVLLYIMYDESYFWILINVSIYITLRGMV